MIHTSQLIYDGNGSFSQEISSLKDSVDFKTFGQIPHSFFLKPGYSGKFIKMDLRKSNRNRDGDFTDCVYNGVASDGTIFTVTIFND